MNDVPLINALPEKYRGYALIAVLAFPYATRAYHALASGGGLKGLFGAILWGTNTPKPPPEIKS